MWSHLIVMCERGPRHESGLGRKLYLSPAVRAAGRVDHPNLWTAGWYCTVVRRVVQFRLGRGTHSCEPPPEQAVRLS